MRVLQLGPCPPPQGGIQTHLVALRGFLLERHIPCAVINLTRFRRAAGDGIYYPRSALGVARLLLRLPYPIIHLHIGGDVTPRLLGLGLFCSLLPRRRTVLTLHSGGYPSSRAGRTARPATLRGLVFRRFDRVIAVNRAIRGLFDEFGLDPDRVRLISPFAVPEAGPAPALPERLLDFFATHRPLLLTVGLLEPEYDLPLQIDEVALTPLQASVSSAFERRTRSRCRSTLPGPQAGLQDMRNSRRCNCERRRAGGQRRRTSSRRIQRSHRNWGAGDC